MTAHRSPPTSPDKSTEKVAPQQDSSCRPGRANRGLDVDRLERELKAARRRGVRDSRLIASAPGLIALLYPADTYPGMALHERAMAAENLIVAAIGAVGGETGHVLSVLFGVDPGTSHLILARRREIAARRMGVLPATWERGWREPQLIADLAARICRLHQNGPDSYLPHPAGP